MHNTHSFLKKYIDKQLKHAEELKTQKGKDKIYNQIERYKQQTKNVFIQSLTSYFIL